MDSTAEVVESLEPLPPVQGTPVQGALVQGAPVQEVGMIRKGHMVCMDICYSNVCM